VCSAPSPRRARPGEHEHDGHTKTMQCNAMPRGQRSRTRRSYWRA
jgi:hypothetical protein